MQGVPGFVPRVLRDAEVGLFRAEERVFDAMLDGWKAQMLARGLTTQTIEGRCRVLSRFQEYAGTFPWTWRPVDLDDYMAERRSGDKPISLTTKVCYAYGLRRREVTMLDLHDFGPNPHVPAYGEFGAVTIRWAKGTAGSGPRRRTVLTVPEFEWVVDLLRFWIYEGARDRFPTADRSAALWPSERADRITLGSLGDAFAAARDAVGLPKELGLHCLRHSYITHLIEAGYDPAFVQTQAGHAHASITGVYTSVGDDFKQKTIQKMIARRIARPEEANPHG